MRTEREVQDAVASCGLPAAEVRALTRAYLRAAGKNPVNWHDAEGVRLRVRVLWGLQSADHRGALLTWWSRQPRVDGPLPYHQVEQIQDQKEPYS